MDSTSPDEGPRGPVDTGQFLRQIAIGVASGLVGAFTMNVFARAVNSLTAGREADGAAPGVDRVGRGMQPPQANGRAEQDAAVRVGTTAYRAITNHEPAPEVQPWLGAAAHYAFSVATGVSYIPSRMLALPASSFAM